MSSSNQCITCDNYFSFNSCKAYPKEDSIPDKIFIGDHDHNKPFKGDNGIRFKLLKGIEPLPWQKKGSGK